MTQAYKYKDAQGFEQDNIIVINDLMYYHHMR